jgi:HEPN domain-containing protein
MVTSSSGLGILPCAFIELREKSLIESKTMTTPKKRVEESPAEAFLSRARQYHLAATTLLPLYQQVESPLYFLFTHALELALKAYLRSHGLPTPRGPQGHALRDLLEQCYRNGLQVGCDLQNVVQLLESENSRHGFRYFLFEGTARPEINYLREVVDELMQVIEEEVSKRPTPRLGSRGGVMKFILGKPEKKPAT